LVQQFYKRDYPAFIQTVLDPLVKGNLLAEARMQEFIQNYCEQRGQRTLEQEYIIPDPQLVYGLLIGETDE